MKTFTILAIIFAAVVRSSADTSSLENVAPHLGTNTPIIWQTPTNNLPKSFWTYKRILPRIFSAAIISNAIVLGSLQSNGFPSPSTNVTCIIAGPRNPCMNVCNFCIQPEDAALSFTSPNNKNASPEGIPSDEIIARRAWDSALQLGIDSAQVRQKTFFTRSSEGDRDGRSIVKHVCGRGIFLTRQLDDIAFFSASDDGEGAEGFSIEFGGDGEIRDYSLRWSELQRSETQETASLQEVEACIRAHKVVVVPNPDEETYFQRIKSLADAKKFTILKVTPYYWDGIFGESPADNELAKVVNPVADVQAVAEVGGSNVTLRILTPILSCDVRRLLANKAK